ncbi:MAG TPA: pitrilysin family protein, partial [Blastocatellia bacterium]|nr:pitrilysin family protein [Blastocatellia bacterium]
MKKYCLVLLAILTLLPAASVTAQTGALKLPAYQKVKLKNGLEILLMERHGIPLVSFDFLVKTGSVSDPEGKEGLASLTAELLREGTKSRSADKMSDELDYVGGTLALRPFNDYTNVSAEFMTKDIGTGLDLLSDMFLNPAFPEDEVNKALKQRIDGIKAAKDRVQGVIGNYFASYLYGSHPYGRPIGGDEKSLAAITRDDVVKFYQTYYAPGNTILAIAGDFDAPEMQRMLESRFGAWEPRTVPAIDLPQPVAAKGKRLLLVDKPDSVQTYFVIGNVGINRTNPDRVYIEVVNTLFGGRFTSMINSALRINSGLTYGAFSSFAMRKVAGPFSISSFTRNATTEKTLDMALEVIKRLHEDGITEEQLKSAKSYIKGQFPTSMETSDQLASLIAQLEFYGLDESEVNARFAKIDAMTVADARRVIKDYFPLDDLVFVVVGKGSEIEGVAKKYATKMDIKSISQP